MAAASAPPAPVTQPPIDFPAIEVIELDETPMADAAATAEAQPFGAAAEIIEFTPRATVAPPPEPPGLRPGRPRPRPSPRK